MQPESTRGAAAKPSPDVGAIARQRCVTNLTNRRIGSINAVGDMSIDWIVLEKTMYSTTLVPPGRFKVTGTGPIRTTKKPTGAAAVCNGSR